MRVDIRIYQVIQHYRQNGKGPNKSQTLITFRWSCNGKLQNAQERAIWIWGKTYLKFAKAKWSNLIPFKPNSIRVNFHWNHVIMGERVEFDFPTPKFSDIFFGVCTGSVKKSKKTPPKNQVTPFPCCIFWLGSVNSHNCIILPKRYSSTSVTLDGTTKCPGWSPQEAPMESNKVCAWMSW